MPSWARVEGCWSHGVTLGGSRLQTFKSNCSSNNVPRVFGILVPKGRLPPQLPILPSIPWTSLRHLWGCAFFWALDEGGFCSHMRISTDFQSQSLHKDKRNIRTKKPNCTARNARYVFILLHERAKQKGNKHRISKGQTNPTEMQQQ